MKISLEQSESIYLIHAYREGELSLRPPNASPNDDDQLLHVTRSCVISAHQLVQEWAPQRFEELSAVDLRIISEQAPEVILFGSGNKLRFPSSEQLSALVKLGIGYEVMDTAAACRTYNLLVAEGRRVTAALFPK